MTAMDDTPEAAMQAVIDAANREDWRAAAQQCDPDSLALFKEHWLRQFAPDNPYPITDSLSDYFADVSNQQQLAELEPDEVFARYLAGRSLRRQIRRTAQAGGLPPEALTALDAHPPLQHFPGPIGAVHVSDEFAYVLCAVFDLSDEEPFYGPESPWASLPESTQRMIQWSSRPVRVMHARRGSDGNWRILAGDDFFTWPIAVRVTLPGEG